MNQSRPLNNAQIRLLIPRDWIEELDTLSSVRHTTRLALIRSYLRQQIDLDLLRLNEHFNRREQVKRSKHQVDAWLDSRKEPDEW